MGILTTNSDALVITESRWGGLGDHLTAALPVDASLARVESVRAEHASAAGIGRVKSGVAER